MTTPRILLINCADGRIVADSHLWRGGKFCRTAARLAYPGGDPHDLDDYARAFAYAVDSANGTPFYRYSNVTDGRASEGYEFHFFYDDAFAWMYGGSFARRSA
jgi:hypothetical protein